MLKPLSITAVLFCFAIRLMGQNTLPEFSAVTFGNNKNIISWVNPYPNVTQINIQRSRDSLKSFTSILAIPDPSNRNNGFVDAKAPTPFVFYRLFIVFDNGTYIFTNSKRAYWDTVRTLIPRTREPQLQWETPLNKEPEASKKEFISSQTATETPKQEVVTPVIPKLVEKTVPPIEKTVPTTNPKTSTKKEDKTVKSVEDLKPSVVVNPTTVVSEPPKAVERSFIVKKRDTILFVLEEKNFKRFIDSLNFKTRDSIAFRSIDTIEIRPLLVKEVYKPSRFIVSDKSGNLLLLLPEAGPRQYSLKFYDESKFLVFEIKKIKEDGLVLDKTNFMEAGWYDFELFEDGKLKEKNKVLIPKDQ